MTKVQLEFSLQVEPSVTSSLGEDRLENLTRFVLEDTGKTGTWAVAVVLTSDTHIQQLHRDFMGIDSPTDVMTFSSDPVEGELEHGGDIVVSVELAEEQGTEHGLSKDEETEFLVVHGLLHLCGWDDRDDDDRGRMLECQTQLIRRFNFSEHPEH
jgi:probable rRNA maturation factor